MQSLQRLCLLCLCLPLFGGCASTLSMWHDKSYVAVLDAKDPEVVPHKGKIETFYEVADMKKNADRLYSNGYLLLGYSKFTHTVVPNFSDRYALMYGESLGAECLMQEPPKKVSNDVYAYTVTFWARGRNYPFGGYYNDMPEDTRIFFPDSLREFLDGGMPVMIEAVVNDSPAANAGIKQGELIAGINDKPLQGAEDMDKRLMESSGQAIDMQVWGPNGLHTAKVQLGKVSHNGDGYPGAEVDYYMTPWEQADYKDFSYISHAFQQAVKDGIANYQAQQEAERQRAYNAYQNARISALEKNQAKPYNPREAPARGMTSPNPARMGIFTTGASRSVNYGGDDNALGKVMSDASASWYFTHKSVWVPTGGMGSQYPF